MLVGSGTKFLSELKIGDQINFVDNGGSSVTRIVQNIESNTRLQTVRDLGTAFATSKELVRQRAKLQSPEKNTSIFKLPYDVVKTLLTATILSSPIQVLKLEDSLLLLYQFRYWTFTGTNEVFTAFRKWLFSFYNDLGSGSTGGIGDIISLSTSGDSHGGSLTGKTLTIDLGSGYNGHKLNYHSISFSYRAKTKTDTAGQR